MPIVIAQHRICYQHHALHHQLCRPTLLQPILSAINTVLTSVCGRALMPEWESEKVNRVWETKKQRLANGEYEIDCFCGRWKTVCNWIPKRIEGYKEKQMFQYPQSTHKHWSTLSVSISYRKKRTHRYCKHKANANTSGKDKSLAQRGHSRLGSDKKKERESAKPKQSNTENRHLFTFFANDWSNCFDVIDKVLCWNRNRLRMRETYIHLCMYLDMYKQNICRSMHI